MDEWLTIDELAARAGMTARNIRAHQTRGLLPPPRLRGRTGYYGPEHVARLKLIKELQAAGFNLAAIKQLVRATSAGSGEEILRLGQALLTPWESETPEVVDPDDLAARFGGSVAPEVLQRAEALGVVVRRPDGRFELPAPAVIRAGQELVTHGVPLDRTLDVLEDVVRHARGVAGAFVGLFLEEVWAPFERAGLPEEELPRVREALEGVRPLASRVLVEVFERTMTREVEAAFGRSLDRLVGEATRAAG